MASGERQAELWGPSAQLWMEQHEAYGLPLAEWILERIANGTAAHILDAGCGSGGSVALAAARGLQVTATDVAIEMLELCKRRVPRASYHVADSEALPFADGTFDAVLALNSLQFTESPVIALREFARVTKADARIGLACFGDPAQSDFAVVGAEVRKLFREPPRFEGPFALSPPAKLHAVIEHAGLHILEQADIELERQFASFEEFWQSQAGTGATRYSVQELGEAPVREAMRAACLRFTGDGGRVSFRNTFHAVICGKR